jgi:flagellar M-ring protein FliF
VRPLIGRMFAPNLVSGGQRQLAPQQIAGQLPAPGQMPSGGALQSASTGALPAPESMIDISAHRRTGARILHPQGRRSGQAHPEEALAIMRTWLHQPV